MKHREREKWEVVQTRCDQLEKNVAKSNHVIVRSLSLSLSHSLSLSLSLSHTHTHTHICHTHFGFVLICTFMRWTDFVWIWAQCIWILISAEFHDVRRRKIWALNSLKTVGTSIVKILKLYIIFYVPTCITIFSGIYPVPAMHSLLVISDVRNI